MSDTIVLAWVGFIFLGTVFFAGISLVQLVQNKKIGFDKGFGFSLSACLVLFSLCLSIWPPLHRVYDDEYSYVSQSLNILSVGKASTAIKGSRFHPEAMTSWLAFTKFPGFAWLEAAVFFLTRNFSLNYFVLNIILGILSVAVVYRIAWLWTASHTVAWWSAVFLACLPVHLTYTMSGASDTAGLFFFLLFLLFISEYRTLQSKFILYAALFSGVYTLCIRLFDGIFIFFGLMAALYIYRRDGWLDKKSCSRLWLDAACLVFPVLTGVGLMVLYYPKPITFSFSFLLKNLHTSFCYMFDYKQNSPLTVLAASGAVARSVFYKKDNLVMGLAGWFLTGLFILSAFYAGGISYPGEGYSDRYILSFVFPLVLLAGKGMSDFLTIVPSRLLAGLFFILLAVNAIFASHKLDNIVTAGAYYIKTPLLKQMVPVIPDKAYIIDECAALVTAETPKKSIQTTLFLSGDHPKEVVFLKGVYDSTDAMRTVSVEKILDAEYRCEPLAAAPFEAKGLSATPFLCIHN